MCVRSSLVGHGGDQFPKLERGDRYVRIRYVHVFHLEGHLPQSQRASIRVGLTTKIPSEEQRSSFCFRRVCIHKTT